MQRIFSTFPWGAPGIALILLRVSIAASTLLVVSTGPHRGLWMLALSIPLSALLCLGFLTPLAALLTIPLDLFDTTSLRLTLGSLPILICQAIALSMLGPGSYSIDARVYGRRIVVIPRKRNRDTR
ncbi:MAG: hypothetical protein JWL65_828 [Gammaproteobacteria bacterium]|jgi:hypothetical protein|nr:hypothetical protein [Gammaproteobacteria bacterium]